MKNSKNRHYSSLKKRKSKARKQKTKNNLRRKNKRSQINRKKRRQGKSQKGGGWAPWEGASSMNKPFANFVYNRFERVPFLSEMGDLSPYN